MNLAWLALALMTTHGLSHAVTVLSVARRLRTPSKGVIPPDTPLVTLLRPARGLESHFEETMASSFGLSYPRLEIIFCVADEDDPAIPVLRRLVGRHPEANASVLIGRDRISDNPKLNNLAKGWAAATADWIVMSDSNILLPTDYIQHLFAAWDEQTAVVSHATVGTGPVGFVAELECASLNSLEARWILAADSAGWGFALGKSMMFRRDIVDRGGGYEVLASEAAEDIASTKMAHRLGLKARLAAHPVPQPIGHRLFRDVWNRQVRWARYRRAGLPKVYLLELFVGGLMPIGYATALAATGVIPTLAAAGFAAAWYGLEASLTRSAGWPLAIRTPFAWIARDLMVPVVWIMGLISNRIEYRGHEMTVRRSARMPTLPEKAESKHDEGGRNARKRGPSTQRRFIRNRR